MIGRNALRQFSWRESAIRIYSTQTVEVFHFAATQFIDKSNNLFSRFQLQAIQQKPDAEWINAKPYNEIPGPGIFSLVTSFMPYGDYTQRNSDWSIVDCNLRFGLFAGKYHGMQITEMHQAWKNLYGDIVRIPGFLGRSDTILTYDPAMVEKVFRTEGPLPIRRGLESFNYYRKKVRPEVFGDVGGLLSEDGDKWWNIRSKANPVLLQPKTVKMYVEKVDQVAQEFILKTKQERDAETLEMRNQFGHELNRWALESIGVIALDERLGALWDSGTSEEGQQVIEVCILSWAYFVWMCIQMITIRIFQLVKEFFVLSYELDVSLSIWKYYKTPQFKRLMWVFDQMTEKIMKRVDNAVARLEALEKTGSGVNTSDRSVLEKLLLIDKRIAIVMAFDMLLAGIDTVRSCMSIDSEKLMS